MAALLPLIGDGDGDGTTVRVGEIEISRADLLAAGAAVAREIGGASAAAVRAEATMATVIAVVGCLLAGVPAVPVPPDSGPRERDHILRDSGAALLLGHHPWDDLALPTVPVDVTARADLPSGGRPAESGSAAAGSAGPPPALILYTSGTTGAPKGVVLSAAAIAADLDALADAWAWTPDDTLVHGLPLFHVHGLVLGVLGALRVGCRLVHTGRPTPVAYAAAGGSLYFGVPTVWSRVCDDPSSARALASARLLVSGSAPLPAPVIAKLTALTGGAPVERYGMTETLITTSLRADGERRPGWVGPALPGIETRLMPADGDAGDGVGGSPGGDDAVPPPADGESVGELQVRGPTLFEGYLGRPQVTAASYTADGWFRTGDAAVIGPDGYHRIVGRMSTDLIKSGGYRVGAGEVEAALLAHPGVREAAVVGLPDDDLGQRIAAFVVAPDLSPAQGSGLADFVARELSVHKRPREIHLVSELPRNPMGKVRKSALVPPATQEGFRP